MGSVPLGFVLLNNNGHIIEDSSYECQIVTKYGNNSKRFREYFGVTKCGKIVEARNKWLEKKKRVRDVRSQCRLLR